MGERKNKKKKGMNKRYFPSLRADCRKCFSHHTNRPLMKEITRRGVVFQTKLDALHVVSAYSLALSLHFVIILWTKTLADRICNIVVKRTIQVTTPRMKIIKFTIILITEALFIVFYIFIYFYI